MNFKVYRSSAGSGKTFTLVKEYLKLALIQPDSFRHILAITFTNKASNEMKERIIRNLRNLADYKEEDLRSSVQPLMQTLINETGLPGSKISEKCGFILKNILHDYADFAVGTIDSFVSRIVKSFAFDLHLPISFEVEVDQELMINAAVDDVVSRVGIDEGLTRLLVNFALSKTDSEKSWNIDYDLRKISGQLFQEDGQEACLYLAHLKPEDFFSIHKVLQNEVSEFENRVKTLGKNATEIIQRAGIPVTAFYQGNKGIGGFFYKLSVFPEDSLKPNSYVYTTVNDNKWFSGKTESHDKSAIESVKSQLVDLFYQAENLIEAKYSSFVLYKLILDGLYPLSVINELGKSLVRINRERNVVHISEFNRKIAEVVLNEPVPFVYEKVGEWYHHFLVDEFQDTSVLQWQNLLPLIDNSLSQNFANIIVGDGKQAIYRFRNGEVEQFAMLPEIFKKPDRPEFNNRQAALQRNYQSLNLETNFRTHEEIVKFNNGLFTMGAEWLAGNLSGIYDHQEQMAIDSKKGGYIKVSFFDGDEIEDSYDDFIESRINEIVLKNLEEGYRQGDIAVLTRSNAHANNIARQLLEAGFQVNSTESVQLKRSPIVNFLVCCLKIMVNPSDGIAQAVVQHFLDDIALPIEKWKRVSFKSLAKLPVFDILEQLLRDFGLCREPNPFVTFFLDAVHEFSCSQETSVNGFLQWWEEMKDSLYLCLPDGVDAIKVMTIHKSKGLEFPVVIFPYADLKVRNNKDFLWVKLEDPKMPELTHALVRKNKKLEETIYNNVYQEESEKNVLDFLNLAYVALTRPIDKLFIISRKPGLKSNDSKNLPALLSNYLSSNYQWEPSDVFETGAFQQRQDSERKPLDQNNLNSIISEDWHQRLVVKTNYPGNWDVDEPGKPRQWGNLLHLYFSLIENSEQWPDIITRFEHLAGDETEWVRVKNCIGAVLSHPELKEYYQPGVEVWNEAEIVLPGGIVFRPDRVVFFPHQTIIIDYKTGDVQEKHLEQIRTYVEALKSMDHPSPQGILVYINEEISVKRA